MSDDQSRPNEHLAENAPGDEADLVVVGAMPVVTMDAGREIPGGWVAITDGRVVAVGTPGNEPRARRVLRADRCLVTPGFINTHHHIYQNLTRSFVSCARL